MKNITKYAAKDPSNRSVRSFSSSLRNHPSEYVYQAATLAVVLYLLLSAV